MASGGAGAAPSAAPSAAAIKKFSGPLDAKVYCTTEKAYLFFKSLFEGQKETVDPTVLGVLTDPDVIYYDHYDASSVEVNDNQDQFNIFFMSRETKDPVGHIEVIINYEGEIPAWLHLDYIEIRPSFQEQGLGKKCMAILEDIAKRKEIKHIYLNAMPERVSYYLGLDPPYAIADNNNGAKKAMFNEVFARTFAERKTAGNTNEAARTAARSAAGNSLLGGDDGEPLVEMTKTLPRKTRRNRRNRRNRKSRKGKRK
jgi:GNAT superfamily N-acetyltransferase